MLLAEIDISVQYSHLNIFVVHGCCAAIISHIVTIVNPNRLIILQSQHNSPDLRALINTFLYYSNPLWGKEEKK